MNIGYILGPAGAGKSTMTRSLFDWMNQVEYDVITLNLDPGVIKLPYSPDIDVRQWVDYQQLVEDHELGPNGGLILAMDHVALALDEIMDEIHEFGSEYMIVDFPGQIETVAFRTSGTLIISEFSRTNEIAGIFLIDPTLTITASSFISILLFGVSITYRLKTAMNYIIAKSDILGIDRLDRIQEWMENPDFLYEDLRKESFILNADLSTRMAQLIIEREELGAFPAVSAKTNENMDIIFGSLQRNWASD